MIQKIIDRYNKGQDKFCLLNIYPITINTDFNHVVFCAILDINGESATQNGRTASHLYDFLYNPEYGWRETFDKDPDWQREFWEWMRFKGYAAFDEDYTDDGCWLIRECNHPAFFRPTPQMLTGYILDFIMEGLK